MRYSITVYKHTYPQETQRIDPRTVVEAAESRTFPAGYALRPMQMVDNLNKYSTKYSIKIII
jgi:hypothetical protein